MNIYAIYTSPEEENISPLIVKQGFSLTACIFGALWALYHRMWGVIFLVILANMVISPSHVGHYSILFSYSFSLAKLFLFGFFAAELKEYYAIKRGMELKDIILAKSEEEAEGRYFTGVSWSRHGEER